MSENTNESTPRADVLDEAKRLVTGDRNVTYGSPTQNFQDTADLWNILFRNKLKPGEKIVPGEVAMAMVGLKLVRSIAQPKADNWTDIVGYGACGYEADVETGRIEASQAPTVLQEVEPLWEGGYGEPEPPERVWRLQRIGGNGSGDHLFRLRDNTWAWASQWTNQNQWDRLRNEERGGFTWPDNGNPNYHFVEVRK